MHSAPGHTKTVFLFAGGGSGGHLSPGLAIAERLGDIGDDGSAAARVLFACSRRPIDARMLGGAGADFHPTDAVPPSPRPARAVRFLRGFARSRRRCRRLIAEHGVAHVLALGGYVSAPAVAAARAEGVPVTLLNLDDPPGRANRWLARRCGRIWTAGPLADHPGFAERVTGLPIRRAALASTFAGGAPPGPETRAACRARLGLDPDLPTLLVTGASQGATSINRFISAMVNADAAIFGAWQIHHLAGLGADEEVRAAYLRRGIQARVDPFLDDVGLAWGAADLAISRAGANSVAEVAANAVPTLFLPYPYHRDQHQRNNARPLTGDDRAAIEEDRIDPEANVLHVGPPLVRLMADPARRGAMRERLLAHLPDDAAAHIAGLLLESEASADGSPG